MSDRDLTDESSPAEREAVAILARAIGGLVCAKFDCTPVELAQTAIGQALESGRAVVSLAVLWPAFELKLSLREAGQEPLELLEVSLPSRTFQ